MVALADWCYTPRIISNWKNFPRSMAGLIRFRMRRIGKNVSRITIGYGVFQQWGLAFKPSTNHIFASI
jgi:hypothetical protein